MTRKSRFLLAAASLGLGLGVAVPARPLTADTGADRRQPTLAERVGADDGFGVAITASADGRGSIEYCG